MLQLGKPVLLQCIRQVSILCGDRSALDCCTDIVTYTSAPLTEDLQIVDEVIAEIHCTADQPSFDLCIMLSEGKPNGNVYNLTQGYIRVNPNQAATPLTISEETCVLIAKGNALCLSRSAACFPAYAVNPAQVHS